MPKLKARSHLTHPQTDALRKLAALIGILADEDGGTEL